ncbi:MAG: Fe(3+) ABC transporter substrate-binding protein [Moraxella sp.]|nr:Fe(3+) ABC transporter substrate-binding protein [Moraxella sp.]
MNVLSFRRTAVLATAISAIFLAGCNQSNNTAAAPADKPADTKSEAPAGGEVTVYSSRNEQLIKPILDKFTEETGVKINLVTDKPGPLMQRLKSEGANSPADMLLTVDAGNLWQAVQENMLQPALKSTVIEQNVPAKYRNPEGYWTGLSLRARTIFYAPNSVKADEIIGYEDLADPKWKGKLCLRTSNNVYNQSLVASLIEHHGAEKTENIVKGWVANLATDPFSNDTDMLKAIGAGQCQVGVANSYYYGRLVEKEPEMADKISIGWADQATTGTHVNVSGAGITTSAKNSEQALKLIEWLSSQEAQSLYSSSDKEYPVNPAGEVSPLLKSWGEFKQDDINVTKFGERQAEAVMLMDKAGYK